jgi:hypothetical protein
MTSFLEIRNISEIIAMDLGPLNTPAQINADARLV